jgi:glutamate-1-semialdehyde 2,1-aminomutase
MTAGRVAMELFDRPAVKRLNALGERARKQITEAIQSVGLPACVTGAGSIFRIHFKPTAPTNYREGYVTAEETRLTKALLDHCFGHGIMLIGTCSGTLSTPMTYSEIDKLTEVLLNGFKKIKELQSSRNTPALAAN